MDRFKKMVLLLLVGFCFTHCKRVEPDKAVAVASNQIRYAKGFSLQNYEGYSIVRVTHPWPKADKGYTYILLEKNALLPDSLKRFPSINIPVKSLVATSTTHIPSLEMLDAENTLVGFPHLDYISSDKVRARIDAGKIKELGSNQNLNTEVLIDLQPEVIIGYGIDNSNPILDNLQKSGLKVVINGDWNEETPLGKAEWIKFFGALLGKQQKATELFDKIEKDYLRTIELAKRASHKPTVLIGDVFEGKWYLPKGTSWGCLLLSEAQSDYLWKETKGTGSLALSFETVFEKAKDADFWITSGQFSSLAEMTQANPHYEQFKAFQNKSVYSFTRKKGKTGGVLYYELAPNRPDLVIKDLVKILHPELLVGYEPFFFEKLQ